jgi:molybdenum cofactor cytidylyltransferase
VVLAAGLSSRSVPRNKLLDTTGGRPMVRRVVDTALTAGLDPVVVVTGHQAAEVTQALQGSGATVAHNPDFGAGMGGSIGVGIAALPADAAGAFILLADMPDVTAATLRVLIQAFNPDDGIDICVPVAQGRRGNPVLFGRAHFARLRAIRGDQGGKGVIAANSGRVHEVPVNDPGVLADYDTVPR